MRARVMIARAAIIAVPLITRRRQRDDADATYATLMITPPPLPRIYASCLAAYDERWIRERRYAPRYARAEAT